MNQTSQPIIHKAIRRIFSHLCLGKRKNCTTIPAKRNGEQYIISIRENLRQQLFCNPKTAPLEIAPVNGPVIVNKDVKNTNR
jgi:hypothetical protein